MLDLCRYAWDLVHRRSTGDRPRSGAVAAGGGGGADGEATACAVVKAEVRYLGLHAFETVLSRKPTMYGRGRTCGVACATWRAMVQACATLETTSWAARLDGDEACERWHMRVPSPSPRRLRRAAAVLSLSSCVCVDAISASRNNNQCDHAAHYRTRRTISPHVALCSRIALRCVSRHAGLAPTRFVLAARATVFLLDRDPQRPVSIHCARICHPSRPH